MAIKIIKEGKKKEKEIFKKTCEECGCVFEFEEEDLTTDYNFCLTSYPPQYHRYIICPCCGNRIYHDNVIEGGMNDYPKVYYTIDTLTSCEDCLYYQQMKDNPRLTVGDTPCTWCKKRQVYCTTNNTSNLQFEVTSTREGKLYNELVEELSL